VISDSRINVPSKLCVVVYSTKIASLPSYFSRKQRISRYYFKNNFAGSVAVVVPSTVTTASTTPTSTVALHETRDTLNADLTEELEEINTFTTADIEADGALPMQTTTPLAENISWSGKMTLEINETDEYDNYLSTLKMSTETVISTESSLEDTTVTVMFPSTTSALVSNSTSVQSDNSSTERNAGLSTDQQIQFSEDIKNKNLLQEIELKIPADSRQVTRDTSLKIDENMSVLSNTTKYEKVKVKRHAKMEDKEGKKALK
jgi:hypothetical protein